jgi:hypothetical protein
MSDTSIEARIAALEGRIADLERQQWEGPPRLGPKPPNSDEMAERLVEAVKGAMTTAGVTLPVPPPVDRSNMCTTSGEPVEKVRAEQTEAIGQHKGYIVLCAEERAKGFVRPYRDRYQHVGRKPKYPLVDLTPEQHERYDQFGYVKFEPFPDGSEESNGGTSSGRYWTQKDLDGGCGSVTTMGRALSETYARDPQFYGSTFCVHCNKHLPVGEFVWTADGQVVGS